MSLFKRFKEFWANSINKSAFINANESKKQFYACEYLESPPLNKDIFGNNFIVVAPNKVPKWALFQCPCNCGHVITLNLSPKKNPRWGVHIEKDGSPSLFPSVRQITGCLSHFWIKNGKVFWCYDTGKQYVPDYK